MSVLTSQFVVELLDVPVSNVEHDSFELIYFMMMMMIDKYTY